MRAVWSELHATPWSLATLAERLADAGYRSPGFVGNPVLAVDSGDAQGFDVYRVPPHEFVSTKPLTEAALAWLASSPRSKLFLYLHYVDPHAPYAPPREALRAVHPRASEPAREPPADRRAAASLLQRYDGEIRATNISDTMPYSAKNRSVFLSCCTAAASSDADAAQRERLRALGYLR